MFGFFFWYARYAALPLVLSAVLAAVFAKTAFVSRCIIFLKKAFPFLFFLLMLAVHSLCALLYFALVAVFTANAEEMSFFFIPMTVFFYYIIRKYLHTPKGLLGFTLPNIVISAVLLFYWIRSAVLFAASPSAAFAGYSLHASPFGSAFSRLLDHRFLRVLHSLTALLPAAAAFVGGGLADKQREKREMLRLPR